MRFSSDFRRLQNPLWGVHYVPYLRLKRMVKECTAFAREDDVFELLAQRFEDACAFYRARGDQLLQTLETIKGLLNQQHHSPGSIVSALEAVRDEAYRLLLFAKINSDAAVRIVMKLRQVFPGADYLNNPLPDMLDMDMNQVVEAVNRLTSDDSRSTTNKSEFAPSDAALLAIARYHAEAVAIALSSPSQAGDHKPSQSCSAIQVPPALVAAIAQNGRMDIESLLVSFTEHCVLTEDGLQACARISLQLGNEDILRECIKLGLKVNNLDDCDQALLYLAVATCPQACYMLLEHGALPDTIDPSSGRTALSLACTTGAFITVRMLLSRGADPMIPDYRGWCAIEHAAYRGHLNVVDLLAGMSHSGSAIAHEIRERLSPDPAHRLPPTSPSCPGSHVPWAIKRALPVGGRHLWIQLGSNDASKTVEPLQLQENHASSTDAQVASLARYRLSLATNEDPKASSNISFPMLGASSNKPWYFPVRDFGNAHLLWKLYRRDSGSVDGEQQVATGIVLLNGLGVGVRHIRESLVRESTIPLLDRSTMECLAKVTFSYFSVTPHPPSVTMSKQHYWEFGNGVGGHRGSGKNMIDLKRLQIGENTIQSFNTAVEQGAGFLELDVQLTSDLVPVIYHDLIISETGTDAPMHTVSYEQFKYLSQSQAPRPPRFVRSNSLHAADQGYIQDLSDRMSRTNFNRINGFKANTRGNFIHEKSCSLDEILSNIPPSVRLNIELKYPMLWEADEWGMELLAINTDTFVNTVLDKVYEYAEGRTVVFSSFSPEICIALSNKQRSWPVFFLSKTAAPRGETRSCCIQEAIRFAKSWGLPGIVTECTPLIKAPRLINYVKSAGLACTSFGALNSDPECARTQFDGGIDAVITDSVLAIRELRDIAESESLPAPQRIYP